MSADQALAFAILFGALALFVWSKIRHDVVAILVLLATVAAGLVSPEQAFGGFGHPAVVTVAAVLILSHGLKVAGVVDAIVSALEPYTKHQFAHLAVLTAAVTVASAFMNNVGALAILMPVTIATAIKWERSPAMFLMPLAFGSLLGGLTTLIGTPPNIIVAGFRSHEGNPPFRMFDFLPVGGVLALVGGVFIVLVGWRLLPKERMKVQRSGTLFEIDEYVVEVRVCEDSNLAGDTIRALIGVQDETVSVVGIERAHRALPPYRGRRLEVGDVLIIQTDPSNLDRLVTAHKLEVVEGEKPHRLDQFDWVDARLAEAVVGPGSELVGRSSLAARYRLGRDVLLIAIARQGNPIRTRLSRVSLQPADVLLLQGESAAVEDAFKRLGLMPLADRGLAIGLPRPLVLALGIFALAIVATASGAVSTSIAFGAAAVAYVLAGVLPIRQLYEGIDWPVVVLLGAMFPLGFALEDTGAAALVANLVASEAFGLPVWVVLTLVLIFAIALSNVINNAATALIMAPLAIGIAQRLGVSDDTFLMAVALGASCAFMTPIGHQSNTLVMGPGGYEFGDYWRMGLPLTLLVILVAVPMLLWVWPPGA